MSCLFSASRTARAQDSFHLKVLQDLSLGADTAPPFFYPIHAISYCTAILFRGAITNYQPNVMRRRFTAIRHHTDCTCRSIFGRRNRYAHAYAAPTETAIIIRIGTPVGTPCLTFGVLAKTGYSFFIIRNHTDAGQSNSSLVYSIKSVTFIHPPCVRFLSHFNITAYAFRSYTSPSATRNRPAAFR